MNTRKIYGRDFLIILFFRRVKIVGQRVTFHDRTITNPMKKEDEDNDESKKKKEEEGKRNEMYRRRIKMFCAGSVGAVVMAGWYLYAKRKGKRVLAQVFHSK
mmetsp:Transcript_36988/g.55322  ORF Transcript_36988/g.55322 Transcript_36988/m.55322 type:complete len:102 (-) Transcript_36988:2322-2627(-)